MRFSSYEREVRDFLSDVSLSLVNFLDSTHFNRACIHPPYIIFPSQATFLIQPPAPNGAVWADQKP